MVVCPFGRQLGAPRRSSVRSRVSAGIAGMSFLAACTLLIAAALLGWYGFREALHTLLSSPGVGQLRGVPCTFRFRA